MQSQWAQGSCALNESRRSFSSVIIVIKSMYLWRRWHKAAEKKTCYSEGVWNSQIRELKVTGWKSITCLVHLIDIHLGMNIDNTHSNIHTVKRVFMAPKQISLNTQNATISSEGKLLIKAHFELKCILLYCKAHLNTVACKSAYQFLCILWFYSYKLQSISIRFYTGKLV